MGKFQMLGFKTVDDFLEYLPPDELKLVNILRHIILECLPDGQEKLAYNVPYYYRHSRICYIWPAAVSWGAVKAGVTLGFCQGHQVTDDLNYLDKTNRKEIATKTFLHPSDIDPDLVKAYLFEAIELDELAAKAKKTKSRINKGPPKKLI